MNSQIGPAKWCGEKAKGAFDRTSPVARLAGRGHRRAQVMVEFAIILPVLVTLLFGIIELSFVFYQDHTLNAACRIAARKGAVGATDTQIKTLVKDFCKGFGVSDSNIVITVTDFAGAVQTAGNRTSGNDINVKTTHTLMFLTPIKRFFVQVNCLSLTSQSQFIIE